MNIPCIMISGVLVLAMQPLAATAAPDTPAPPTRATPAVMDHGLWSVQENG